MESVGSLFEKDHMGQLILSIILIIYLIMGFKLPLPVAKIVDSLLGKIAILGIVTYMFSRVNPVLSLLSILVAFDLIRKSYISTGNFGLNNFVPSELMKSNQLTAFNQFPYTLEQEVIAKRAPIYNGGSLGKAPYRPFMENLHDAAKLSKSN
jgi:hypothetical protein